MNGITRVSRLWPVAMLLGLVTACAHTPPEPVFTDSLQSASATVESVESVTRLIALRTPQGERLWIVAGPEVRNFAQIRAGDTVTVNYYKAIAAQVKSSERGCDSEYRYVPTPGRLRAYGDRDFPGWPDLHQGTSVRGRCGRRLRRSRSRCGRALALIAHFPGARGRLQWLGSAESLPSSS
jgi:hypothetical protein